MTKGRHPKLAEETDFIKGIFRLGATTQREACAKFIEQARGPLGVSVYAARCRNTPIVEVSPNNPQKTPKSPHCQAILRTPCVIPLASPPQEFEGKILCPIHFGFYYVESLPGRSPLK